VEDPETGECLDICEPPYKFDYDFLVCVDIVDGGDNCPEEFYNPDEDKCIFYYDPLSECPPGKTFDEEEGVCI
jgi:hypothetical protein